MVDYVPSFPSGEVLRYDGSPTEDVLNLPFYGDVPKDLAGNLAYRERIRRRALKDRGLQRDLLEMCRLDILWWVNCFAYLYEPRPTPKTLPFITWPHQDVVLAAMDKFLGRRDMGGEKSRGEGFTYLVAMLYLHRWLFDASGPNFGLVSRNEDAVDKPNDPNCIMWKIDDQLRRLPKWMTWFYDPNQHRSMSGHSIWNPSTSAIIQGFSATGFVGSGGRMTSVCCDEFAKFPVGQDYEAMASLQHVTDCRILVSTPVGPSGAYYDAMHDETTTMLKLIMAWEDNPSRNRGLYRATKNKVQLMGKGPLPDGYEPMRDNKLRSPWYDNECRRMGASPELIARELDRDYGGSTYLFFPPYVIESAREEVREPVVRGEIEWEREHQIGHFGEHPQGEFLLWRMPEDGKLPASRYTVACDVAAGLNTKWSSNSALVVVDITTMEQVAEWANSSVLPVDFAILAVNVCNWLKANGGSAYLIWDAKGQSGGGFTQGILEHTRYRDIYRRKTEIYRNLQEKQLSDRPGFITNDKSVFFEPLRDALRRKAIKIRSEKCVEELQEYEMRDNQLRHVKSRGNKEHGLLHGDRAVAMALAYYACLDRPGGARKTEERQEIPYGSPAWNRQHEPLGQVYEDTILNAHVW